MQFIMTLCVILSIYTCIHMYSVASYVHVVRSTYWYAFIPYGLKFLCECVNDIQYLWPPCIGVCVKEVELVQGVLQITRLQRLSTKSRVLVVYCALQWLSSA